MYHYCCSSCVICICKVNTIFIINYIFFYLKQNRVLIIYNQVRWLVYIFLHGVEHTVCNNELVRWLLDLACLSVGRIPMLKKTYICILIDLFIACGNADMHATAVFCVVVFCVFFYFNRDVLFYYAYVFPYISRHLHVYPLEYICIYSIYLSCFLLVFCMVQLLCVGLSRASTFKDRKLCQYHAVIFNSESFVIHYFLFCLFLTECCVIQCLCLPLPS